MIFTRKKFFVGVFLLSSLSVLFGCRGQKSTEPPIHLNPNMDIQAKYHAYDTSKFFADGRAMRPIPAGTIPRGYLKEDSALNYGKSGGQYILKNPLPITQALLDRGQERFEIYCTVCHGATGNGQGIASQRGMLMAPSFLDQRAIDFPDGQFYDAIYSGVRNMQSYKAQVKLEDRWAIVAYIRALQRSQNATINDVPTEHRSSLD